MKNYLKLLRVKHYIKNVLIFMPLFFDANLFDFSLFAKTFYAFIPFCLGTSVVYIINDINDVEKDRRHPTKCKRPIASGAVSVSAAKRFAAAITIILTAMSLAAIFCKIYSPSAVCILVIYIFINFFYSSGLKNIPIVDIAILAAGFLIRLYYGAFVSQVKVSSWLYLTVLGGAFYLGMGKRRNELQKNETGSTRSVLKKYNYAFLDKNMHVCMAFTEITYALWAVQNDHQGLKWTVPIVMLIFMKYSLTIESEDSEGNPMDVLLSDRLLILLVVIYIVTVFVNIYVL